MADATDACRLSAITAVNVTRPTPTIRAAAVADERRGERAVLRWPRRPARPRPARAHTASATPATTSMMAVGSSRPARAATATPATATPAPRAASTTANPLPPTTRARGRTNTTLKAATPMNPTRAPSPSSASRLPLSPTMATATAAAPATAATAPSTMRRTGWRVERTASSVMATTGATRVARQHG